MPPVRAARRTTADTPEATRSQVAGAFHLLAPGACLRGARAAARPDCAQMQQALENDPLLNDEERLHRLKDYRADMETLCREVARTVASEDRPRADAMVNLAATVAAQVRVAFLGAVERSGHGWAPDAYDTCMASLTQGAGCEALWAYERQLVERLKDQNPTSWAAAARTRITHVVQTGKDFLVHGLQKTAQGALKATQWVVTGAGRLWAVLLPTVVRLGLYVMRSPHAALLAFMYVKHMKQRICRFVARMYVFRGEEPPPPPGTTVRAQLGNMAGTAAAYAANVGPAALASGLGAIVQSAVGDGGGFAGELLGSLVERGPPSCGYGAPVPRASPWASPRPSSCGASSPPRRRWPARCCATPPSSRPTRSPWTTRSPSCLPCWTSGTVCGSTAKRCC
jgi:hypothetical protein